MGSADQDSSSYRLDLATLYDTMLYPSVTKGVASLCLITISVSTLSAFLPGTQRIEQCPPVGQRQVQGIQRTLRVDLVFNSSMQGCNRGRQ